MLNAQHQSGIWKMRTNTRSNCIHKLTLQHTTSLVHTDRTPRATHDARNRLDKCRGNEEARKAEADGRLLHAHEQPVNVVAHRPQPRLRQRIGRGSSSCSVVVAERGRSRGEAQPLAQQVLAKVVGRIDQRAACQERHGA